MLRRRRLSAPQSEQRPDSHARRRLAKAAAAHFTCVMGEKANLHSEQESMFMRQYASHTGCRSSGEAAAATSAARRRASAARHQRSWAELRGRRGRAARHRPALRKRRGASSANQRDTAKRARTAVEKARLSAISSGSAPAYTPRRISICAAAMPSAASCAISKNTHHHGGGGVRASAPTRAPP